MMWRVAVLAVVGASAGACGAPRLVYIDVGVNWANTLTLYTKIGGIHANSSGWEVYGWEANPYMYGFIENATEWLNRERAEKPLLPFPPTGSLFEAVALAPAFGCPIPDKLPQSAEGLKALARSIPTFDSSEARHSNAEYMRKWKPIRQAIESTYACVVAKTLSDDILRTLTPTLYTGAELEERMAAAGKRRLNCSTANSYTLIPAAAGAAVGTLNVQAPSPAMIIRGLSPFVQRRLASERRRRLLAARPAHRPQRHSGGHARTTTRKRKGTPTVKADFVSWLKRSFTKDDFVVLKMDIEGGEHELLPAMGATGAFDLIDVFAWECHTLGGSCAHLQTTVLDKATTTTVLVEGQDYEDNLYL